MFLFNVRYRFVASWIRKMKQEIDERKSRKAEEKSRDEEIDEPIFQSSETKEDIEKEKPEVIFSSLNNAHIENNDEDSLTEEEISKLTTFEFTDLSKKDKTSTEVNEDSENVEFEVETNNGYTTSQGIKVPIFEIRAHYNTYLHDLNNQERVNLIDKEEKLDHYPGLKVGSVDAPNNNAGNWE